MENVTLMIGTGDDNMSDVIRIIKNVCRERRDIEINVPPCHSAVWHPHSELRHHPTKDIRQLFPLPHHQRAHDAAQDSTDRKRNP
jgi:hypothetical protein